MPTFPCPGCGLEVEDSMRFCRHCGRPLEASEATTRKLPEAGSAPPATYPISPAPTTPSYVPPDGSQWVQAATTNSLESRGPVRLLLIAGLAVLAILVVIGGLMFMTFWRASRELAASAPPQGPPPSAPPSPMTPPPLPPLPPMPPPPSDAGAPSGISRELAYPGSEVLMERVGEGNERALFLRTKDPIAKVVAWYKATVQPTAEITLPGGNAVMKGDGLAIVISVADGWTNIHITQRPR
jgi:zinc-ribbon domain